MTVDAFGIEDVWAETNKKLSRCAGCRLEAWGEISTPEAVIHDDDCLAPLARAAAVAAAQGKKP